MLKRFLAAVVLSAMVGVASSPALATLTNSNTKTDYSTNKGTVNVYSALITATGNDTTDPADSDAIVNLDGSMRDICAAVNATNQTGTNPTLQLKFLGAHASAGPYFIMQASQADTAGTTADADAVGTLDISTASTTNVAQGICASSFGIRNFPPYVKVRVNVGGTGSPGWTGVVYATVFRGGFVSMLHDGWKHVADTVVDLRQRLAA
jgi:hypothetical protein